MKNHIYLGLLFLVVLAVAGCSGTAENSVVETNSDTNLKTANLEIEGMTCQSCALGVEYELKQVTGVVDANVDYTTGRGIVTFDSAQIDAETIAKASAVYPAKLLSKFSL